MDQANAPIIRCPSCGAGNRVPLSRVGQAASCGKCGAKLPPLEGPEAYKLRCGGCGARNRVPAARLGAGPKCGKCGTRLDVEALFAPQPLTVTDADFEAQVMASPLPVLMFAWAPWCTTCTAVAPVIDQFAREVKGRMRVAKVNIDTSPAIANRFNIMSVPFIFIFDNGQLRESQPGAVQKHELLAKVAPYL